MLRPAVLACGWPVACAFTGAHCVVPRKYTSLQAEPLCVLAGQSQSQYRERQKKQHLEQQQAVQILTKDVERLYAEISDLKRINASLQGSGSLDATTTVKEASQGDEGLTAKQAEFGCYNASLQSSGSMDAFTTVRDSPQSSAERPLDVPEALLLQVNSMPRTAVWMQCSSVIHC